MSAYRCPLCNEVGHSSMTCPSLPSERDWLDGVDPATEDRLLADHIRNHLTDGQWHDSCPYCRHRRVHGGNGIKEAPLRRLMDRGSNG